MKKNLVKILAIALIMCLTVPFVACVVDTPTGEGAYAYVAIDINPSLELIVKDEVVVKVRAINDDANVLLSGETIEGLSLEEATEKIVSLAEELGYLNEENTDVNITVTTEDEEATEEIEKKAEKGAKRGSLIAIIKRDPREKDKERVEGLKEQNPELYKDLTPAMNRIIEEILELNPELTYEALMEMSVSELIEMLETLAKERDEAVSEEVKKEMGNRHKELKDEAKRKMDELYEKAHKEKAEAEKENIELDEEQKAELDKIKEEMKDSYDKVKEEFKDKIEESKKEFDKIKEQKREENRNKPQKPENSPENEQENEIEEDTEESTEENPEENAEESTEENTEEKPKEEKPRKDKFFDRLFGGFRK